jgi:predicted dehydrogenase
VRYVEARVQTRFFPIDVDDVALLLLEHENGAISTVSSSWGMPSGAGDLPNFCEVHARNGSLRLVSRGKELHQFSRDTRNWNQIELPATDSPSGHAGYLEATLKALHAGEAPPITGAHARHNLCIIEAARKANDQRRAIDLNEL